MASGSRNRPPVFPPGMNLSDYYKVERLVRLAEGRMYYLVNDHRPDRPHRRCWECGDESNASDATHCGSCGASLAVRRFVLSTRWERSSFEAYLAFFQRQLAHPAFLAPCDVFPYPEDAPTQICSVVPYNNETFLLDEPSPLPIEQLIHIAQRTIGLLAMFAFNGVRLGWLHRSNFLLREDGEALFYDAEVGAVSEGPLQPDAIAEQIQQLGALLRRYTPIEDQGWQDFFAEVEEGTYPTTADFGQALQQEFHKHGRQTTTEHAGMTDVGLHRPLNEDNWGWGRLCPGVEVFVVCDGMGGHDCGEVASKLAGDTLLSAARRRVNVTPRPPLDVLENILDEAFQEGNNTIKSNAEARGNDMGTTMVACMVVDDQVALCANVGDSRGYLIRNGQLHQITRDHSLVQRMVEQNRLTPEEARNHPHSNILLRTVGTERNVEIDIFRVELEAGDRLLLCSDGLWGEVEDAEIESILNHHEDNRVPSRELIRAAHVGGGKDNITLILIHIPSRPPPVEA